MNPESGIAALIVTTASLASAAGAEDIALGQAIYDTHCAACHGAQLEGAPDWKAPGPDGRLPPPPHDETGHTWHHGDAFLFEYVRRGGQPMLDDLGGDMPSGMPGFGDRLTDEEISAVLAYIRSTWPARIQEIQAERTAREQSD